MSTARPALPAELRLRVAVLAALAFVMAALLGLLYAGESAPDRVDRWALGFLGGPAWDSDPTRTLALVVDSLSEPVGAAVLLTALVAVCLALGRGRLAIVAVVGAGLAVAVTTVLKPVLGRTINGGYLAYPSGHTAFLTVIALVGALLVVHRFRLGLLVVAAAGVVAGAAMGWSQTVLVAHYPTDTVGGFCVAVAVVPATALLVDRFAPDQA